MPLLRGNPVEGTVPNNTVFSALGEWFASDITGNIPTTLSQHWLIHFVISVNSVVQYTLNSGTNWYDFNNGSAIGADKGFLLDFTVRPGDTFNIRAIKAVTVRFARIDQI